MRETDQASYFTVFEGTYSRQVPLKRRAPVGHPRKASKTKIAAILVVMLFGVSTAAVALTMNQRAHSAASKWEPSATYVSGPGIASFEDALY